VTNTRSGRTEVYETRFNVMHLPDIGGHGALVDSEIPGRFVPFDAQDINGDLYLTYACQNPDRYDEVDYLRFGFVDKLSPSVKLRHGWKVGSK
jgi:hypothetical protein